MAKAEVVSVKIALYLDKDEAEVLSAICNRIGGSRERSRRGLMDNIDKALTDAGITSHTNDISTSDRAIYFNDTK